MGLDNPLHIAFLLVILLLVFGAKRLPEIGRSLGEGMRGFKSSIEGTSTPTAVSAHPPAIAATGVPVAAHAATAQSPDGATRQAEPEPAALTHA